MTTGFASLKYLVWKSAGDSSLALSRSISTLSQWATGWIIGLSDKNIYGNPFRSKLLHFKLYVPLVWLDSIKQNHGETKPPLMQAYFLDMFLIYKDPKSAEKLSFSLEFLKEKILEFRV